MKIPGRLTDFFSPVLLRLAKLRLKQHLSAAEDSALSQKKSFGAMIRCGRNTAFGREHGFDRIRTHADFVRHVPVMDYEKLYPYIQRILDGEKDVLWPGRPVALASTSGTSMGPIKYIPVTEASAPAYRKTSRDCVLAYMAGTRNTKILGGKMLFMSQNPEYQRIAGIPVAPISGVSAARVPRFFKKNLLPSPGVAIIEDWGEKLDAMLDEAMGCTLTLIGGIPPWLLLFFDHIIKRTGEKIGKVFPDLAVIVHGGVNFEPYQNAIEEAVGRPVDFIETYAATEGFIAFQDSVPAPGMMINLMGSLFYEFIPADEIHSKNGLRLRLDEVEIDRNYGIILTSKAGLWAYDIGDTVKFISKNPCRLIVTGRSKHYISAFGEHLIVEQADAAISHALASMGAKIREYTVAPSLFPPGGGLPHHEWFIEFETIPGNPGQFTVVLDEHLRQRNIVYNGLVDKKIIGPLDVQLIRPGGFRDYMESIGKLGGQNKVPHILNDRRIADALLPFIISRQGAAQSQDGWSLRNPSK